MTRSGVLPGRVGWGLADQALSSLTNFGLSFLIARAVGPRDFGAFGVALVTYWTMLGIARALSSQPLVIRFAGLDERSWRSGVAAGTGAALAVAAAGGVVCIAVAALSSGTLADAFLALGISMPGLLLQDTWRFAFFAHARGRSAFANDLVWTVVQFPLIFALMAVGHLSVLFATLAWGAAATVAALFGIAQANALPDPRRSLEWLRAQRDLWSKFVGEVVIGMLSSQLLTYGIGAVAGLTAVGTIRAGNLLLSPLNVLSQAINLTAVPEGVRALRSSPRRLIRLCLALGALLGGMALSWGVLMFVLPASVGVVLLRDTWEPAHTVILPLALSQTAAGIITGASIGVRAMAAAGRSLRATTVTSTTSFVANMVGVVRGGAVGAVWGGAAVSVVNVAVWWTTFLRGVAEHTAANSHHVMQAVPLAAADAAADRAIPDHANAGRHSLMQAVPLGADDPPPDRAQARPEGA